jgi:hypothetical protein
MLCAGVLSWCLFLAFCAKNKSQRLELVVFVDNIYKFDNSAKVTAKGQRPKAVWL